MCMGSSPSAPAPAPTPPPPPPPVTLKQAAPDTKTNTTADNQAKSSQGTKKYRSTLSIAGGDTPGTGGLGIPT